VAQVNISKYENLIPHNAAPTEARRIGVYSGDIKVGDFGLSQLRVSGLGKKQYSFGAISDVHLQRSTAEDDFKRALQSLTGIKGETDGLAEFVCVCGDLTDSGTTAQLEKYKSCVGTYANADKKVYSISGNHEAYGGLNVESVIEDYTGQPLYYKFTHGNDVFIMLGIVRESSIFAENELQKLYEWLEENRNKRCFIFQHVFGPAGQTEICGNAHGLYNNLCWYDANEWLLFENLLKHYKNTIWFHGHSHFRFNLQTKNCQYANVDKSRGYWSVHIPSIAIPRLDIDADGDGKLDYYTAGSEGYVVDVYEKGIVLRGRDFFKNEFIPIATYYLDTALQTVEAGTFEDPTGMITVGG
jgi:predicted phosphodiesterase